MNCEHEALYEKAGHCRAQLALGGTPLRLLLLCLQVNLLAATHRLFAMTIMRALWLMRAACPLRPQRPSLLSSRQLWLNVRSETHQLSTRQPKHHRAVSSSAVNAEEAAAGCEQAAREKQHYSCPACGQRCYRLPVLQKHLLSCCPDIVSLEEWERAVTTEAALHSLLAAVAAREEQQRERSLELTFRQRDSSGQRIRQDLPAVAAAMGLSHQRAERLLRFAMRAVPLAADTEHPVEVLFEDEDLLAVNKPPGVITAPKHRYVGGSMVNRVKGRLGFEPLVLHRLDMNTSGVLLFAKTRDVVPALHAQFREKTVRKEYLALAVGVPGQQQFTVDAPIDKDEREKIARRVASTGKPAVTNFRVVATSQDADLSSGFPAKLFDRPQDFSTRGASLIQCEPLTGRTHQIRVHLAYCGHAIVGDDVYGLEGPWIQRHCLHAYSITVLHPRSGAPLRVQAPLPEDIQHAMRAMQLPEP